ncbi:hypothetical protein F3Y22_tig00111427pilonHSYRG00252 [Hibiscus syriacus]|uniref:Uncharacterized protein n=1 Tax=Hibiscus syriacus TaxID=106335 RepID=A0A6A2XRD0_HIBSY|nr:hypothetical protein F3Y22_tig00111427pilonHSYRG00252 [Hibiscus syriacus]
MGKKRNHLAIFLQVAIFQFIIAEPVQDKQALLDFLNSEGFGCVSDIGLAAVMSPMPPPAKRVAVYRASEVTDTRKATQASDEIVHLVRWASSVVREDWTAEVFDVELVVSKYRGGNGGDATNWDELCRENAGAETRK